MRLSGSTSLSPRSAGRSHASTRFALEGLSEALAKEIAPLGIHVTLVEPGSFRTDFLDASSLHVQHATIDDYADKRGPGAPASPACLVTTRLGANAQLVAVRGLVALAVGREVVIAGHAEDRLTMALLLFGGPLLYFLAESWYLHRLTHVVPPALVQPTRRVPSPIAISHLARLGHPPPE